MDAVALGAELPDKVEVSVGADDADPEIDGVVVTLDVGMPDVDVVALGTELLEKDDVLVEADVADPEMDVVDVGD